MSGNPAKSTTAKRAIPSVDRVLKHSRQLIEIWGHRVVSDAVRDHLAEIRQTSIPISPDQFDVSKICLAVEAELKRRQSGGIQEVHNLTGVVLHTNLGRASLAPSAAHAAQRAGLRPNNLEFDLQTGKRGNRDYHVEDLICELTGAEAATVVNNNAAAVVLVLNTLAAGREVPVSRGELVEIGGSFRMPEIMKAAGCELVEIGATNRTHEKDYTNAITDRTALLMKVHTSNYRVEGFSRSVSEISLSELARQNEIPSFVDLGSGCLIDLSPFGLPTEPKVSDYVGHGVDVLTFSGDKLLGGPQCGLVVGRRDIINQINKNPLKRAFRVDSMILAALSETLKLYRFPDHLRSSLPTLRLLTRSANEIQEMADRLLKPFSDRLPKSYECRVVPCFSQIGSGALPVETLPSFALAASSKAGHDADLRDLAKAMRQLPVPVIGRISDGNYLLDLRCLERDEDLIEQLSGLDSLLSC